MATVQLVDVYVPAPFARGIQEAQVATNRFMSSGIVAQDSELARMLQVGGTVVEVPFFQPLGVGEPNYSTDNPAVNSTPKKISGSKQVARSAPRNQSWSTMDLARDLALIDPVGAITGRIGRYWATDDEQRIIKSCLGILADNVANDSGDMLKKVGTDASGAVADAERIAATVVIDGQQTMGDHQEQLVAMAIHSAIWTRLKKQNLITFIPPANGQVGFATYLNLRLIVDDSLPVVAGTNRLMYTSILFGASAFLTAPGPVNVPSEYERKPSSGNGGGEEIIYSRVHNIFHPNGFSFTSSSVAGQSPTYAELATAANWDRKVDRKHVAMSFIQTND